MKKIIGLLLIVLFFYSCKDESLRRFKLGDGELVDVSTEIIDLEMEQIVAMPDLVILGDYLIISDVRAIDKGIHIFDKHKLEFLGSTGVLGEGPGQITRYGEIAVTPNGREFWMPDFAKLKIFKFDIDSVLMDDSYLPSISKPFEMEFFLTRIKLVDENLALGTGLQPLSINTFRVSLGRWDLNSGKIEKFGEEHSKLIGERTNAFFDYSYGQKIMALAHINHDILTVYDSTGTIKYHILGEKEFDNHKRRYNFFGQVRIGSKFIFSSYLGSEGFRMDENQRPKSVPKSKILAFDLEGNLSKIFETGHELGFFVVDDHNKRVICYFADREVPIGYFYYE